MKKRAISILLVFAMVLGIFAQAVPVMAQTQENGITVSSPTENGPSITVWVEDGKLWYTTQFMGQTMIEKSQMGMSFSMGDINDNVTLGEVTRSSGDTTWEPLVGERDEIRDNYNAASVLVTQGDVTMTLELRAYDEGVAFRYLLPESDEDYEVLEELTRYAFPAGTLADTYNSRAEALAIRRRVEDFSAAHYYRRPMTFTYTNGLFMTFCEANLDNYSEIYLYDDASTDCTLRTGIYRSERNTEVGNYRYYGNGTVKVSGGSPSFTPWRTFVMADKLTGLQDNSTIVLNLNEPADEETYKFSEWVKNASCMRSGPDNTESIKQYVDMAAEHGFGYLLIDSNWYGPEADENCDPRLDPALLTDEDEDDQVLKQYIYAEGCFKGRFVRYGLLDGTPYSHLANAPNSYANVDVNIPEICEYANSKGIGILLYVNGLLLPDSSTDNDGNLRNRFTIDELFAVFEKWGVKGVKPGFVNNRAQEQEQAMIEVMEAAAKHKLVITAHDDYVTSGLERTYPNVMCVEGIFGDEAMGNSVGNGPAVDTDIANVFMRCIQGVTDHTFCFPGKATKAYALASPLMFKTNMSVLYWYTSPAEIPAQDKETVYSIWDNYPGSWNESLFLEGSMYEYATFARRSGEKWYLSSLSAVDRVLDVPLDFLADGVKYVADIYCDGADADPMSGLKDASAKKNQTLHHKQFIVDSETAVQWQLHYAWGYAATFTPASEEEIATLAVYDGERELIVQTAESYINADQGLYEPETWTVYEAALTAYNKALTDGSDNEALSDALDALEKAYKGLLNTDGLTTLMEQVPFYADYIYTEESWAEFTAAVEAAETLLAGDMTQDQVIDATERLQAAMEGLEILEGLTPVGTYAINEMTHIADAGTNSIRINRNRADGTLTLRIDGQPTQFANGVGFDAPGGLTYDLSNQPAELVEGWLGVDNTKYGAGDIIFRIYVDDVLFLEDRNTGNGIHFSIPVSGAEKVYFQADMNGIKDSDWADLCDVKFLHYQDPEAGLLGITVDGTRVDSFDPDSLTYKYPIAAGSEIPQVEAVLESGASAVVTQADGIPGFAKLTVTTVSGMEKIYTLQFRTSEVQYISDLPASRFLSNTGYSTVLKRDKNYNNTTLTLTLDGVNPTDFEKGLGVHAETATDSSVVIDIDGLDSQFFEAWVGTEFTRPYEDSTVTFRVYVDDEETPCFDSGEMKKRIPAKHVVVDVAGASTIRLQFDPGKSKDGDWSNWCDAKLLTINEYIEDDGHNFDYKNGVVTDPTCTEMGYTTYFCKTCDYSIRGDYVNELGHSFGEGVVTREPSADEAGEMVCECTVCGEKKTEKLDNIHLIAQQAQQTAEAAQAKAEQAQADAAEAQADAEAAQAKAEAAQAAAQAAEAKAEAAQAAAEQAAESAGEDAEAAEAAQAAAQAAKTAAEAAQAKANDAQIAAENAKNAAEDAQEQAKASQNAANAAKEQAQSAAEAAENSKADAAKEAAEAAKSAMSAAEDAGIAAAEKAEAAKQAKASADSAAAAAMSAEESAGYASEAAKSAAAAQEAQAAAEAAKEAAEAAQKATEAEKQAAEAAKGDAQAAQAAAEAAQASAKAAQEAAEAEKAAAQAARQAAQDAQAAAEAAQEAAQKDQANAQAAKEAAEAAQAAAEAARKAAETEKLAAEAAQKAAEDAEEAANAAQKAAEEERLAAEAAWKAAEEERKAAEEAKAAAEAAQKAAEEAALKGAKYQTALTVRSIASGVDTDGYDAAQIEALETIVADALDQIEAAETVEEIEPILEQTIAAIDGVEDLCHIKKFSDVDPDAWYHAAIDFAVANAYMKGDTVGTFRPTDAITRAEMAQILYNIENQPEYDSDKTFEDVAETDWFYDAVMWAASENLVKGDPSGTFRPDDKINREEMITIIWRYFGSEEVEAEGDMFNDIDIASEWAVAAIIWGAKNEIVNGVPGNMFNPKNNTERAAIAQVLLNMFG